MSDHLRAALAADVRAGLGGTGQKTLPPVWFYDPLGSALFDAICLLPEYGVTRAEERLIAAHAAELAALLPQPLDVAELGSGSGRKTGTLLAPLAARAPLSYFPIEISDAALAACATALGGVEGVAVTGIARPYLEGIGLVTARRQPGRSLLVLFLGSTIGNFDRAGAATFVTAIRARLVPGDAFLLAADLVKPVATLLKAYDDPVGVTAAFNRNLLARINRELRADFDLGRFDHEARWDDKERRIEMHLRARTAHKVWIEALDLTVSFEAGETIWTESSHKFVAGELADLGERSGFRAAAEWTESEWGFSQTLLIAR